MQSNGLNNAFYAQATQQLGSMHFGGFWADAKPGGDFLEAPAGGKEFENLAQAWRQFRQLVGLNPRRLGHEASGGQVLLKVAEARFGQH